MSDVDKLSNADERIGQMEDERRRAEKAALDAELTADPIKQTADAPQRLEMIPWGKIDTSGNLRTGGLPRVHEMALSLKERGLIVPISVRQLDNPTGDYEYELIEGGRRIAGYKIIHPDPETPIAALVKSEIDETERYEMMFTAMAHFADWTPLEKARAFRFLLDRNPQTTAAELARSLGISTTTASSYLRALELPASVLDLVDSGDLSFTIAELIQRGAESGKFETDEVEEIAGKVAAGEIKAGEIRDIVGPDKPKQQPDPLKEGDDSDVPFGAKVWDPESDPEKLEEERRRRLESQADDLLNAAGPAPAGDDDVLPWEDGQTTANGMMDAGTRRRLDSYLLGRLLRDHADDGYLDEIGTSRDETFKYAFKLEHQARLTALRQLAQLLAEDDPQLPSEIFPEGL